MALLRSQYGHTAPPSFFFRAAQVVWERHFPRVMMKREVKFKKKKEKKIVAPEFFFSSRWAFSVRSSSSLAKSSPPCMCETKNVEQRAVVFQLGWWMGASWSERLTGDVGSEMLKGQDIAGVHHKLHFHTDRLFASGWICAVHGRGGRVRAERWWGRRRWVGRRRDGIVGALPHRFFHFPFVVENADGTVLSDAIRHFTRIDPHRQFRGEESVQELAGQTDQAASVSQDRVHFAVDADATIAATFARLLGKPVLLVAYPQSFDESSSEDFQLLVRHDGRLFVQS